MLLCTHFLHYKNYNLACRNHTNNVGSWKRTMTNKVIKNKSKCGEYLRDKSRYLKQKHNKNVVSNIIKQTC